MVDRGDGIQGGAGVDEPARTDVVGSAGVMAAHGRYRSQARQYGRRASPGVANLCGQV